MFFRQKTTYEMRISDGSSYVCSADLPIFIAATLGFLGYGFYAVYRKPRRACAGGAACARTLPNKIVRAALWLATAMLIAAAAFPYVAPWLLGIYRDEVKRIRTLKQIILRSEERLGVKECVSPC